MSGREFEIIERFFSGSITYTTENVILGPGDDCAILNVPEGYELAISTDTFNDGVHFPSGAPARVLAHRCLCANLSDLAAMGAAPFAFTLALTMPSEEDSWLEAFSVTLGQLVSRYEIPLVGGNLSKGPLSCTIAVMGTLPVGKGLRRSGACEGDDIYVSGTLGDAAGGLRLIDDDSEGPLIDRYYYPVPRLSLGISLLDIATSAIDISDGLISEIGHICKMSGVGARIDIKSLPLSVPLLERFGREASLILAVNGGDDYELCFTAPPATSARIQEIAQRENVPVTRIGQIVAGRQPTFVDDRGRKVEFPESGYQHFHEG